MYIIHAKSEDTNPVTNDETSEPRSQMIEDLNSIVEVDGETFRLSDLIESLRKAGTIAEEVSDLRVFHESTRKFIRQEGEQHEIATAASKMLKGIGCSDEEIDDYLEMWVAVPKTEEASPSPGTTPEIPSLAQIHPLPNQPTHESRKTMTIHTIRDSLREVLATEGYIPKITDAGNISFKFEGTTFYLVLDESDLQFAAIHQYLECDLKEPSSYLRGVVAAHTSASDFKIAKVAIDDAKEMATVSAEVFFHDYETVRKQLPRLLRAVRAAANKFEEEYERLSEEQDSGEIDDGVETSTDSALSQG